MSNFRDEISRVIATDPRYSLEAYAFVLESLHLARNRKIREAKRQERNREESERTPRSRAKRKADADRVSGHVTGRQVCLAARRLALREYGLLALPVLNQWGLHSTSDIGEIVYNLIDSGDLDRTPEDRREDFDDVFDFQTDFQPAPLATGDSPETSEDD